MNFEGGDVCKGDEVGYRIREGEKVLGGLRDIWKRGRLTGEVKKKMLPFGNIEHFLNKDQLSNLYKQNNSNCKNPCDNDVNNINSPCINETIINSIISP